MEDMSPAWRRIVSGGLIAGFVVALYFIFVAAPVATAQQTAKSNSERIDGVQGDIREIKGTVIDLREKQAANSQKLEDVKESVAEINSKLDRLLMQNQRRASVFP